MRYLTSDCESCILSPANDSIAGSGFEGFAPVARLRENRCASIPDERGLYVVVRRSTSPPEFLPKNPGGHFKARNPTVSEAELRANWVDGTPLLYIGQAGGGSSGGTLRRRVWTFLRFGAGAPVGHWGGQLIWQLKDSDSLELCWKPTPGDDPRDLERELLQAFYAVYDKYPFANLQD